MKVLVDANIFTRKQKTGVDYYTLGLILATARQMPDHSFILTYFGSGAISITDDIKNIQIKQIWWLPSKMYGLYRHYLRFLPFELFAPVKADAMFFPDFGCPPTFQKVPKLVVIHDLVYLLQPEYVQAGHRHFLDAIVQQALQQSTGIVVNSKSTANDLERAYPGHNKQISIIPPAVDHDFYKPATKKEIDTVKNKYGINGDYILFLSTLEPRKNVANIIRAYDTLPEELKDLYQLVLAGKKGWLDDEIEDLIEQMGERVVRTGRVETSEKPALYTGASVFAFPSAYEGFGMPILEAMSCGTPVITSSVSSMPEVAGEAALLVNPDSTQEIQTALIKVLTDVKAAQDLSTKGKKKAAASTWDKSGKQLAILLNRLVKS